MIGEIWLWTFLWQSTAFLTAGLGGSYLLRRRPARAHHLLFIAMIAAVAVPALSHLVKQRQWGLFETPASAPLSTEVPAFTAPAPPTAISVEATPHSTNPEALNGAAPAPASAPFDWPGLLLGLWIAAGTILLVRLAIRFGLGVRLVRQATTAKPGAIEIAIGIARHKLSIDQEIAAQCSGRVHSPMIWCWNRRPVLLIPAEDSPNASQLDLVGIVCHELAHWKRRDHVSGLLAELLLTAMPWQLLLWWASRRLTNLSEEACDDWVLACGRPGIDYAETLLTLTPHGHAALVPAVVTSKNGLVGRIQRILQDKCASPHAAASGRWPPWPWPPVWRSALPWPKPDRRAQPSEQKEIAPSSTTKPSRYRWDKAQEKLSFPPQPSWNCSTRTGGLWRAPRRRCR